MSEKEVEDMTDEEYATYHQNRVYQRIRAALPGDFEQFSHEQLTEMILNVNRGYTAYKLREDLQKEFEASPREFMIDMLEQVQKKCDTALHLLTCTKCGIGLPKGERSA